MMKKNLNIDWSDCGPITLVVVQPTSFCNLNCDYCYLPDRHLKNTLSLDLIEPIFQRVFSSRFLQNDFTICWHAGEPLAVPLVFMKVPLLKLRKLARNIISRVTVFVIRYKLTPLILTMLGVNYLKSMMFMWESVLMDQLLFTISTGKTARELAVMLRRCGGFLSCKNMKLI